MGREIKRVPAGFDWPLDKVWGGFINPHFRPCSQRNITCFGGRTAAAKWMDALCRFIAEVGRGCAEDHRREELRSRGVRAPHPYLTDWHLAPRFEIPEDVHKAMGDLETQQQRSRYLFDYLERNPLDVLPLDGELLSVLAKFTGITPKEFGEFGSTASWDVQKTVFSIAGVDVDGWGRCPVCAGDNLDPAVRQAYEAWQETPIPTGDWWQVWETVSEGSPVTPAFKTDTALVDYLVANGDAWDQKRGKGGWPRPAATRFVKAGWAPSMVAVGNKVYTARDEVPGEAGAA